MKRRKTEFDQLDEECDRIVRNSPDMLASMMEMRAALMDVHRIFFGDEAAPGIWHGVEYVRGSYGPFLSELPHSKQ